MGVGEGGSETNSKDIGVLSFEVLADDDTFGLVELDTHLI